MSTSMRYATDDLVRSVSQLFESSGLAFEDARLVAEAFIEADLLGFVTHGLNRVACNLDWLERGETIAGREPEVLVDRGAVVSWDAQQLPGPLVVARAVDLLCDRARQYGIATMNLRRAQHIACLAAYLRRATDRGLVIQIIASSPAERAVSAFGGSEPIFAPNPFAFAVPTEEEPILIDMSLSIVAAGYVAKAKREGVLMDSECLKDSEGNPSDDPAVYSAEPPGSIMPIGGLDHGYKGYALTLWSELMTMALGNYGRADELDESEENSVFIQVMDPDVYGSLGRFQREAQFLADMCRTSAVREGEPPVRVPGDRALALRRQQLEQGVILSPHIMQDLFPWFEKFGVTAPTSLQSDQANQ
ncbi:Ldh family oxidoreductase [Halioglobus maricola]|uniref:Ldh family oxidoreductase n=1 Tax=Halioglobus maricola TaxID=2601894 RepID=A0A5P9NM73_9GAMM|nr:Ldh family oxidoreductase [Halioglobus maricola]QFU76595.1 Ldh family oxidoreductase [Halioglobus maricola]